MKDNSKKCLFVAALSLFSCALFVVSSSRQSVADILDFASVHSRSDAEFVRVLETLGHDRFETYVINGQTIHTSVRHVDRLSPPNLLRTYQTELVAHGVNDRSYFDLSSGDWEDRLFTGLQGGLVPFRYSTEHVAMGGVVTHNRAIHKHEALEAIEGMAKSGKKFRGFRNIEILRAKGSLRSTVVATWGDDVDFDAMQPGSDELSSRSLDADVAPCPGCTRVHHFEHPRRASEDKGVHLFIGDRGPGFYSDWYRRTLTSEGYQADVFDGLNESIAVDVGMPRDSELLVFRRGSLERRVTIQASGKDTFVHVHTQRTQKKPDWSTP